MMKKSWKNKSAVSPVIATILMVAITVVLAAVLYVMVMGFGTSGSNTPSGAFSTTTRVSTTSQTVTFATLSPTVAPTQLRIVVQNGANSDTYNFAAGAGSTATATALTAPGTVTVATVTGVSYTDMAADQKVSSGDYLTVTLTGAATGTYTISMLYIDTGATINSISFTR